MTDLSLESNEDSDMNLGLKGRKSSQSMLYMTKSSGANTSRYGLLSPDLFSDHGDLLSSFNK